MRKEALDEMQVQKRNKIGNQAFLILSYLLLADIGLYGFGFRWLQYPMNVFIMMLAVMFYYLIRIIWNGAYVGPGINVKSAGKRAGAIAAAAAFIAAISAFILQKNGFSGDAAGDRGGAVILFVFSAAAIVIAIIVGVISIGQNRGKDD